MGIIVGLLASAAAISFVVGCEQAVEQRGQLIITFQTDMALPTQIDNVRVQLTARGGSVLLMDAYSIGGGPNDSPIPGSLALNAGANPEPITITVAGSKDDVWRTYREIVTTVPRDRVAELRMPIQWLCNESAQPQVATVADGKGGQVSRVVQACDDGYTCKAGACVSNETDSARLPDFDPAQLYGGAKEPENGTCFDVVECLASGTTVEPDQDCTIEKPTDPNINVALRVAGGGICNDGPQITNCFVPLDGEDPEGWTTTPDGTRIQLPEEVCTRLADRKVLAVQTSAACEMKKPSHPPCGMWSAVPDSKAILPDPMGPVPTWPSPELFATLPSGGDALLCCPLMSENDQLYGCMCTGSEADGDAAAIVYSVDMQSARRVMFPLSMHTTFAASVYNQTLYWTDGDNLHQFPLQAGATPTSSRVAASLYDKGVLLTDASGIHVLASGLGDENEALRVVNLLHFTHSGQLTSMDPLGNRVVNQFSQDATAFYAAVNVDEKVPEGQPFQRMSSVVRIDKQSHAVSTLLNARTLTISNLYYNGYLGVVSDGTDAFALYESEPQADFENLQIGRVTDSYTAAPSELDPIYDIRAAADPHLTLLRLLGAVDGAVFFARDELLQADRLRSSSVLVIPRGQTRARFVADFSADAPIAGIFANEDRVFWMNQSGRIFALSREALAP